MIEIPFTPETVPRLVDVVGPPGRGDINVAMHQCIGVSVVLGNVPPEAWGPWLTFAQATMPLQQRFVDDARANYQFAVVYDCVFSAGDKQFPVTAEQLSSLSLAELQQALR